VLKKPRIAPSAFVAPGAVIMGDVTLGDDCSVFFGAVLRAEYEAITVGDGTNIQDNCVLHVDPGSPLTLGRRVTVGHGAILHGCAVGDDTLIGMGAIVLNGAVIGSGCMVAAGALVPGNAVIPDGTLVMGAPARVRRELTEAEIAANTATALEYIEEARQYKAELQ
jgi:carbonic anhydrase/acetyltransferase-like protein (isoleucine patch superfamily)